MAELEGLVWGLGRCTHTFISQAINLACLVSTPCQYVEMCPKSLFRQSGGCKFLISPFQLVIGCGRFG